MRTEYGFYFESSGRGAAQGAISPAEQFFEGSRAESSLVRETAQNSIDARAGEGPVTMVFELADMPTDSIPGIAGLRIHLAQVEAQSRGSQGHEAMKRAHDTANRATIPVLRVSDYGTRGLSGTESINDPTSPLSSLTRGAGISADDGSRGGSFGIGSAVGPMASDMNTVLYTSLPVGQSSVVLAGYSSLATHRDSEGKWRVGDGFLTDMHNTTDFSYLRDPGPLGPFATRSEPGTDLFILGYRMADVDKGLQHIKVSFMRNFLMAIDRGTLVVRGVTPSNTWELNQHNIQEAVREDPESEAFYRAIHDPEPAITISPRFGKLALYVNVDDSLEKSLHTVTVRKPLMKIDTFRHTSIPVKYAAVLECSDDAGNALLRKLEPPQHHKWDPGRAEDGAQLVRELKNFVRDGLRSRVRQQIGDQVEVTGLSRYLPTEAFEENSRVGTSGIPTRGDGVEQESSTVRGNPGEAGHPSAEPAKTVRVKARVAGGNEGQSPEEKGKDRGGSGTRGEAGGRLPGKGGPGDGSGRIRAGDVSFRSWSDVSTGDLCIALTPREDVEGDLELVPLGSGGSIEDDYTLPISHAVILNGQTATAVEYQGNTISKLNLKVGLTTQVRLTLSSTQRFRLGIK